MTASEFMAIAPIADAWTGSLVYGRDEEGNSDMDALRKGVKA